MKRLDRRPALILALVSMALLVGALTGEAAPASRVEHAVRNGLAYLRRTQQKDGSWQRYPGITAMAVLGFLRNGVTEKDPAVAKAIKYIVAQAKPDGALYTNAYGPAQALPNYNTALCVLALKATGNPRYQPLLLKARAFLVRSQFDEGEGFKRSDRQYGGIGYGKHEDNPDVSNLQQALEALRATDLPANDPLWQKAILFLQRCQNRKESNDQSWAGTDGGFVYAANGESKADPLTGRAHSSYGSMTYAGLKSYLYAGVSRKDPRAQAAFGWIRRHYTVSQNPGMGDAGLYYYYHTMGKTLAVYGQKALTDAAGKRHVWARDLTNALVARQQADGSWVNRNARWREDDPHLVTGYVLVTLANCRPQL